MSKTRENTDYPLQSISKSMGILQAKLVDIVPSDKVKEELIVNSRELKLMAYAVEKSKVNISKEFVYIYNSPNNAPSNTCLKIERRFKDYNEYLLSSEWQVCRRMALHNARHRCQLCNSSMSLNVHHRTYKNIYKETLDDLIVLCKGCHENYHKDNN